MTAYVKRADGKKAFDDRLGRRQDAALERARRLGAGGARRRRAGRLLRARDGSGAADARDAGAALAHPDAEDAADREARVARGPAPVPLSVRRPQRPHRPRQPARLAALEGRSPTPSASSSTTTASSCSRAKPVDPAPLVDQSLFEEGDLLHDVLASLNSSELARRRFREIARVAGLISQGFPGPAEEHAPAAGVELAVLRGLPQVRRRQHAARPGRERGAEPGARHPAAARGAEAHARAARRLRRAARCRARSRCR